MITYVRSNTTYTINIATYILRRLNIYIKVKQCVKSWLSFYILKFIVPVCSCIIWSVLISSKTEKYYNIAYPMLNTRAIASILHRHKMTIYFQCSNTKYSYSFMLRTHLYCCCFLQGKT